MLHINVKKQPPRFSAVFVYTNFKSLQGTIKHCKYLIHKILVYLTV